MKKTISVITILLIIFTLSACQKTPESPIVVGKGDRQLERKILEKKDDAALPKDLPQSGTHIEQTIEHDTRPMKIIVDADVQAYDDMPMPAVKVKPHKFTQEDADRFINYFVGDSYFADIDTQSIDEPELSQFANKRLKQCESRLEAEKANPSPDAEMLAMCEESVKEARKGLLNTKELNEFPEASKEFSGERFSKGNSYEEEIMGFLLKDGIPFRLWICNDENGKMGFVEYENCMEYFFVEAGEPKERHVAQGEDIKSLMPYKDALKIAEDTVKGMGAYDSGLRLAFSEGVEVIYEPLMQDKSYYQFIYTHEVNGILNNYDNAGIYADTYNGPDATDETYIEPWDYERLVVSVDRNGLSIMRWESAYEITETLAESTPILPFEDIMACFTKMAFIKNSYMEDYFNWSYTENDNPEGKVISKVSSVEVYITRISLSLMRVQTGREYLLIPVWDFYGYKRLLDENGMDYEISGGIFTQQQIDDGILQEQKSSFMTINAVDGSVIDRDLGY